MSRDDDLADMIAQLAEVTPEDERGHICIEVFRSPADSDAADVLAMHVENISADEILAVLHSAAEQVAEQVRAARAKLN